MAQKNMMFYIEKTVRWDSWLCPTQQMFLLVYHSNTFFSIPMSEKQQRLVYAIIEFLNQSIKDGTVKADDQEGLEVASGFSSEFSCRYELIFLSHQFNALAKPLAWISLTKNNLRSFQ